MRLISFAWTANTASRDSREVVIAQSTVSLSVIQRANGGGMNVSKYRNQKTIVDGITFDSKKEANRWAELKLLERAGKITFLQRQVSYVLVPKQVRDGKMIERPVVYKADFAYKDENGEDVVEDVKSPATKTQVYILKRKLLLWEYGLQVREV
jgi:hypothetical protein